MVSLQILQWLAILVISWHPKVSLSEEVQVCCCPDLTLSLSAVVSDTTKSLQNGFMFVAKKGSNVTLKCELGDKDHPAIKTVVYKFHKTYELSKSKPITVNGKNKELCSGNNAATCDLKDVKYTDSPGSEDNMDKADNQIYQCYAEITLQNDDVVKLWSHTIKLDVYYAPTEPTVKDPIKMENVNIGKNILKLQCVLPVSNPKTKAQWSFKKKGSTDPCKVIDIPDDTQRGKRLVIAEDDISDTSKSDNIERGMLLLMIINADEDQGTYKCEGVYDSVFDDQDTKFDITSFEISTSPVTDVGDLLLRTVSAITEPKLVNQDSTVNFTVYARDTPGRGKFKDVTYTWQIKDDPDVDVDLKAWPELSLSNNGRTLTLKDLTKHKDHEFHCKIKRSIEGASDSEITSTSFGVKTDAFVIAPKHLSIPLTSRTCINHGDNLKTTPNKAYMMNTATLAGSNPKQILLKADTFKYYLNDYRVGFIKNNENNYDNATDAGVTQAKYAEELKSNENARCVYWQYLRGYSSQYQVIEVMKVDRLPSPKDKSCTNVDMISKLTNDTFEIKIEENKPVTVTVKSTAPKISTNQCLKMHLVDLEGNIVDSKSLSVLATSCVGRSFPNTVEFTKSSIDKDLKIKICPESSPYSATCFDSGTCLKPERTENVKSISPEKVEAGDKFTVTCNEGYVPKPLELTCEINGTVSPPAPQCNKKQEPSPDPSPVKKSSNTTVIVVVVVVVLIACGIVIVAVVVVKRRSLPCSTKKDGNASIDLKEQGYVVENKGAGNEGVTKEKTDQ